jgi:hypothetical protein
MPSAAPLRDTLARCEADLQRFAVEAVASGDYPSARLGMELAEKVAALRTGLDAPPQAAAPAPVPAATPTTPASAAKAGKTTRITATAIAKRSSENKAYPRFAREGDKLVKIGWSKRTKKEYEHKAPRAAVEAFVGCLRNKTRDDRMFTIDDLMPVPDPENDGDLPAYQVYLTLAWLRSLDTVKKHGRDGYSVKKDAITNTVLAQAWNRLPSSLNITKR